MLLIFSVHFALLLCSFFNPPPEPRFEAQTIDANVSIGYGLALGDVDGDGKTDILLADQKQFVWYRNGDWKRFVLAENLTQHDNVCIAAKDLDGDGKVEVAVGAQWNPGETANDEQSGSVHYLVRPADPTTPWKVVTLYHEPTIHRMRWTQGADGAFYLAVLPLHGRGNTGGQGEGVNLLLYRFPDLLQQEKPAFVLPTGMHQTHNLDPVSSKEEQGLFIAGKEGLRYVSNKWNKPPSLVLSKETGAENGAGEVRLGRAPKGRKFWAAVEPMHGNRIVVYTAGAGAKRVVLDTAIREGHALATADLLGRGGDQVVAGWRNPNSEGKVGIKLYEPVDAAAATWRSYWVDENGMACEDLQVADLNGDGKLDIVASGRSTRNLKIYWNKQ